MINIKMIKFNCILEEDIKKTDDIIENINIEKYLLKVDDSFYDIGGTKDSWIYMNLTLPEKEKGLDFFKKVLRDSDQKIYRKIGIFDENKNKNLFQRQYLYNFLLLPISLLLFRYKDDDLAIEYTEQMIQDLQLHPDVVLRSNGIEFELDDINDLPYYFICCYQRLKNYSVLEETAYVRYYRKKDPNNKWLWLIKKRRELESDFYK
jgi:hypothetical protein